jgi:hypothetical protein
MARLLRRSAAIVALVPGARVRVARLAVRVALLLCAAWAGAAGAETSLQPWLAARLARLTPDAGWKEERGVFEALLATGQKSFEPYLVARALHRGDPGRYAGGPMAPELDAAALLATLRDMPAYRHLQARIRAHPGRAKVEVVVPGTVQPRVIADEAAPESSNALMEAIRSAPLVTGPTKRREVDVVAELPALVHLLGDDLVKARVLVQVYRERTDVFAPIFAKRKADPAFAANLERLVGESLTALLREPAGALVRDLLADLDRDGFPLPRLRLLSSDHPAAFDDIVLSHLRVQLRAQRSGEWRFEPGDGELLVRTEAGHLAFAWRISLRDFLLGDEVNPAPILSPPDSPAEIVRRCVGKVCLP